jgi:hypothetical protein
VQYKRSARSTVMQSLLDFQFEVWMSYLTLLRLRI